MVLGLHYERPRIQEPLYRSDPETSETQQPDAFDGTVRASLLSSHPTPQTQMSFRAGFSDGSVAQFDLGGSEDRLLSTIQRWRRVYMQYFMQKG